MSPQSFFFFFFEFVFFEGIFGGDAKNRKILHMGQSPSIEDIPMNVMSFPTSFMDVPKDVQVLILRQLSVKDIVSCMSVCKRLYECGKERGGLNYSKVAVQVIPHAARHGNEKFLDWLLQRMDVNGYVLHLAVRAAVEGRHDQLGVNLLRLGGYKIRNVSCQCLLSRAAMHGCYGVVCALLEDFGANPEVVWLNNGMSVFAGAVSSGNLELVHRLLQENARPVFLRDEVALKLISAIEDLSIRFDMLVSILEHDLDTAYLKKILCSAIYFDRPEVAFYVSLHLLAPNETLVQDVVRAVGCSETMWQVLNLQGSTLKKWTRARKFAGHAAALKSKSVELILEDVNFHSF